MSQQQKVVANMYTVKRKPRLSRQHGAGIAGGCMEKRSCNCSCFGKKLQCTSRYEHVVQTNRAARWTRVLAHPLLSFLPIMSSAEISLNALMSEGTSVRNLQATVLDSGGVDTCT